LRDLSHSPLDLNKAAMDVIDHRAQLADLLNLLIQSLRKIGAL